MRFDDRLVTVLAREPDRQPGRIALWRQLIDLIAQHRGNDAIVEEAGARLAELAVDVPVAVRREVATAIAGRTPSRAAVAVIAADVPPVAGAILAIARLPDEDWIAILPRLSPTGRGFLRHRSDLSPSVASALATFGASDLRLGGGVSDAVLAADATATRAAAERAAAAEHELAAPEAVETAPAPARQDAADEPVEPAPARPEPAEAGARAAMIAEGSSRGRGRRPFVPETADFIGPFEPDSGEGQIRAIISRIARYRRGRVESAAAPAEPAPDAPAESFAFETAVDGVIRWIEGVPRSAVIGETIAIPASGAYGVDAQAPGAFRRRAPFRDARLLIAGAGPAGGEWRIAGVPVFDPGGGRFMGYRGTARRPRAHERAEPASTGASDNADSLRQLVHELRTPLNAIGGFAEMIRRQMRGPVAEPYRESAGRIVGEAGRLLIAVDDLDISARLDSARLELGRAAVDLRALVVPICAEHADATGARPFCIAPAGLPAASGDPGAIRRMVARLLAAASGLAADGERVAVRIGLGEPGRLAIRVTRPARLAGVHDTQLFDPSYGPEGDWPDAPLLGLGFSLHLVRRLAIALGGQLLVDEAWFSILLPVAADAADLTAG